MKILRIIVLFGTLIVFLYLVNSGIISAENNLENGTIAYFDLRPRDPRSLVQGDYMTLNYRIENEANRVASGQDSGQIVLSLDENKVAHFERSYVEGDALAENEIAVNFYVLNGRVRVVVDSFLFQEGQAADYNRARYAEVRILPDGGVMLVNLADENLQTIIPE